MPEQLALRTSKGSFFLNLNNFERRSGLKNFPLKMGGLSKFQSHRSKGDVHFSLGADQRPPTQIGFDLSIINFDNHPFFKVHSRLLLVVGKPLNHLSLCQPVDDQFWVPGERGCGGGKLLCRVGFKSHQLKFNWSWSWAVKTI